MRIRIWMCWMLNFEIYIWILTNTMSDSIGEYPNHLHPSKWRLHPFLPCYSKLHFQLNLFLPTIYPCYQCNPLVLRRHDDVHNKAKYCKINSRKLKKELNDQKITWIKKSIISLLSFLFHNSKNYKIQNQKKLIFLHIYGNFKICLILIQRESVWWLD